jgi:predicted ABC-type ATPase
MIVLAGPNGAGKSTLYESRIASSFAGPFINADIIQRDELRDPSPAASYEAASIAS